MALFGKKKQSKDKKDLKDVKSASEAAPASTPSPMPSTTPEPAATNPAPTSSSTDPFVNPFENGGTIPPPTTGLQHDTEDLFSGINQGMNDPSANNAFGTQQNQLTPEDIQEMIDETVEKIIEEKWDKVVTSVEKVVSWKDTMEQDLNLMKEDLGMLKQSFDKLEKKLIGKLSDYDKDILDVSSEIKALEKVFQKITPTLVNNINELSRITSDLKGTTDKKSTVKK